ncbi:MAG: HAD family hydrolase [Anaerolineales bacterium]|nr:HAD family hydrolase [Anaerolineales bacterium]
MSSPVTDPTPAISAILLDLDDTLIDHTGAEQKAAQLFGRQFADTIPDYVSEEFPQRWKEAAGLHFISFLSGEISFQEQRRRRLRTIFRREDLTPEEADTIFNNYLKYYEASWEIYPDVAAFLENHAYLTLSVISNGEQAQQEAKLDKAGIRHYFRHVLTADSAGLSKPDPRFFHQACSLLNLEPFQVCCIGNNLENDTTGANDAGLRGVWLNRSGKPVPEGIESISSLADFRV